jgi:hypothetical protein
MKYLIDKNEDSSAYLARLIKHYGSAETREEILWCLAMEWKRRYIDKMKTLGKHKASTWWANTIDDMEKKRGKPFVADLRLRMNKLKETK